MKLSKYQQEIDRTYTTTNKNIVIEAGPGSGKTFILIHLAKKTSLQLKTIFLAFNKSIVEELGKKLPSTTKVMTLHSLGMRNLLSYWGCNFKVNEDKTFILSKKMELDFTGYNNKSSQSKYRAQLSKLVDLYRMNILDSIDQLESISCDYDIIVNKQDLSNVEKILQRLEEYNKVLTSSSMIDFVDMLWLNKNLPKESFFLYDLVMIDECQDLNPLQKFLIDKILKPNGRFIAVGDSRQLIYQFMGSNIQSFNEFKVRSNTEILPLSISYRCSKKVIEEANKIFPGIEASDDAVEGEVYKGKFEEINEGDFVLYRNNLPLVELYIKLLSNNKRTIIYGKDYGEQLLKLLHNLEDTSIENALLNLNKKREDLVKKLIETKVEYPLLHPKILKFNELYSIIKLLFEKVESVTKTIEMINQMFKDIDLKVTQSSVVLLTCHKSKGLENDRIFFLKPELIPSKYAQSSQMLYAEKCLYYVAVTRAKTSLIYLD